MEGPREFNELCKQLKIQKSGLVTKYLEDLTKSGFISRDFTWHVKDRKESKLSHFRLSDNYLRFYLRYIEKNKGKIEIGHFEQRTLSSLPGWDGMIGLQFENLVLNNRRTLWEKLSLLPEDIVTDNPYFQRKTARASGCQIDYIIQTRTNALYICEIKFSRNEITDSVMQEVKNKINRISLPRGFSCVPVLVHASCVADSVLDAEYFVKVIDFTAALRAPVLRE